MRVNKVQIDAIVDRINTITESPLEYGQPGNFFIDNAYGGYSLRRCTKDEEKDVLQCGYQPAKRMIELLFAFIEGINILK